jgi:hypothetical protein
MKHKTPPRVELPPTPRTNAAFDLRHNQTCTITWFRQVLEEMERELIASQAALEAATKGKSILGAKETATPHVIIEEDAIKLPEAD